MKDYDNSRITIKTKKRAGTEARPCFAGTDATETQNRAGRRGFVMLFVFIVSASFAKIKQTLSNHI